MSQPSLHVACQNWPDHLNIFISFRINDLRLYCRYPWLFGTSRARPYAFHTKTYPIIPYKGFKLLDEKYSKYLIPPLKVGIQCLLTSHLNYVITFIMGVRVIWSAVGLLVGSVLAQLLIHWILR